ncbi:MAG: hypothetical protein WBA87_09305 [Microbacterium sp.]
MSFSYDTPSHPIVDVTIAGIGDPWTESRRNVAQNPRGAASGKYDEYFPRYGWPRSAVSGVSGNPLGIPTAIRLTCPGAQTGAGRGMDMGGNQDSAAPGTTGSWVNYPVTPGVPVTVSALVRSNRSAANTRMTIRTHDGAGAWVASNSSGPSALLPGGVWTSFEHTYTPPAGSAYMVARVDLGSVAWVAGDTIDQNGVYIGSVGDYFDGSTNPDGDLKRTRWVDLVDRSASVEEVRAQGDVLRASGGTVTLDENYSPYVSSSVMVPLTAPDLGERIDPRTDQRVTVTVADESLEFLPPRTFDLGIRDRTVDHGQQTLTIEAASDEARLHDTCRLATTADRTARAYEGSLRGIVNWALEKIGAELEPGGPDRDMTASWDQTNLHPNGRAFVNTDGWSPKFIGSGAGGLMRFGVAGEFMIEGADPMTLMMLSVATAASGFAGLRFDPTEALPMRLTEGRLYTASGFLMQGSDTVKTGRIWFGFKNDAGETINSFTATVPIPPGATVPVKVSVTGLAPVNTSTASIEIGIADGFPAGRNIAVTACVIAEGVQNERWHDGDRPDEPDLYVYDYTPTRGTPSTRVALDPREPDMFSWDPGESLFDFLRPFLEASGLRLFCDESRRWWLVEPAATDWGELVEAFATGAGGYSGTGNAVAGTDVISRDRDDWATGVVVAYTWRTANGDRKTQYDAAGTPGKVVTIERATAYPGPGAAEAILAAMSKRGRTQSASITRGFQASPGYASRVSLPGTDTQDGRIRRVVLELATGNAQISTNGTETP